MPLKRVVSGLIIVLASSMMMGCLGTPQESETEPTSAATSTLSLGGEDGPMPLDHPVPVLDLHPRLPPGPPDLDMFNEPWERNPLSRGCTMSYVTIYDPANDKRIELPVTTCY